MLEKVECPGLRVFKEDLDKVGEVEAEFNSKLDAMQVLAMVNDRITWHEAISMHDLESILGYPTYDRDARFGWDQYIDNSHVKYKYGY